MLQSVEAEIGEPRGVRVAVDSEYAALFVKLVWQFLVQFVSRGRESCFSLLDYCALRQLSTGAPFSFLLAARFTFVHNGKYLSAEDQLMRFALVIMTGTLILLFSLLVMAGPSTFHSVPAVLDAAQVFSQNCAKCHGKDGRAKGMHAKFVGARNLTDPEWQNRVSDERIFNSINNGKGKMPAFGKKLPEDTVNALVSYVRSLKK
jgi:cytochrome c5